MEINFQQWKERIKKINNELGNLKYELAKEESNYNTKYHDRQLAFMLKKIKDNQTIYEYKVEINGGNKKYLWYDNKSFEFIPYGSEKRYYIFHDTIRENYLYSKKHNAYPNLILSVPDWSDYAALHNYYYN